MFSYKALKARWLESKNQGHWNHLGLSFYLHGKCVLSLSLSIKCTEPGGFREAGVEAQGETEGSCNLFCGTRCSQTYRRLKPALPSLRESRRGSLWGVPATPGGVPVSS